MTVLTLHIDSPELVLGLAARRAILDPLIRLMEAQQNRCKFIQAVYSVNKGDRLNSDACQRPTENHGFLCSASRRRCVRLCKRRMLRPWTTGKLS